MRQARAAHDCAHSGAGEWERLFKGLGSYMEKLPRQGAGGFVWIGVTLDVQFNSSPVSAWE